MPSRLAQPDRRAFLVAAAATTLASSTGALAATGPATPGEYAVMTANAALFTKALAERALASGSAPRVLAFARLEIEEARELDAALKPLRRPRPVRLNGAQAALLAELHDVEGAAFDRRFIALQVQGHHEALEVQLPTLAMQGAGMPTETARRAEETIRMHLDALARIRETLS